MPYGDLARQAVQRFAEYDDLKQHECTIEEREKCQPHLELGLIVYAGVDYERILRQAEQEVDLILWDGGNNDLPFYKSDFSIVVVDPYRPDHERQYHPGEANVFSADVVVINKVETAHPENTYAVRQNIHCMNPRAILIEAASPIFVDYPQAIRNKRVLVVEDGPTLTHGEMSYGAGWVAAHRFGASEIIDLHPFTIGSIKASDEKYPSIGNVLPAIGYGPIQLQELQETIHRVSSDPVLIGTPIDLGRLPQLSVPSQRIRY